MQAINRKKSENSSIIVKRKDLVDQLGINRRTLYRHLKKLGVTNRNMITGRELEAVYRHFGIH